MALPNRALQANGGLAQPTLGEIGVSCLSAMVETKKFRTVYWVTEQLDAEGRSLVAGVFTSVHDLMDHGFAGIEGSEKVAGFRLNLCELDTLGVLGKWSSPDYEGLENDLKEYVATSEVAHHEAVAFIKLLKDVPLPFRQKAESQ